MTNPRLHSQKTELPRELVELRERVAALSETDRRALEPLVQRVIDSTRRRQRIMQLVQEALSQLRLDMKYLVFDLEATRRERDALRERSEED